MKKPLEFCALQFLLIWERKERVIRANLLASPSPVTLKPAMHHFRVSRNFPGIGEVRLAMWVLDALHKRFKATAAEPVAMVEELTERFNKQFGKPKLSAASKLLWLKHRDPFVIYDSQAVTALERLGRKFDKGDYGSYAREWRLAYNEHKPAVAAAVALLPALHPFVSPWHNSPASIQRLAKEPWFRERVFDIYLWELGAKK